MEIEEAREKKKYLEKLILDLLNNFQEETQLAVENITIDTIPNTNYTNIVTNVFIETTLIT